MLSIYQNIFESEQAVEVIDHGEYLLQEGQYPGFEVSLSKGTLLTLEDNVTITGDIYLRGNCITIETGKNCHFERIHLLGHSNSILTGTGSTSKDVVATGQYWVIEGLYVDGVVTADLMGLDGKRRQGVDGIIRHSTIDAGARNALILPRRCLAFDNLIRSERFAVVLKENHDLIIQNELETPGNPMWMAEYSYGSSIYGNKSKQPIVIRGNNAYSEGIRDHDGNVILTDTTRRNG